MNERKELISNQIEQIREYVGKKILCDRDYFSPSFPGQDIEMFTKGNFYKIDRLDVLSYDDDQITIILEIETNYTRITFELYRMWYNAFITHFKLITLPELRKEKINKILK